MNKIPRIGFFQSSIWVSVEKILIHLGRYLKSFFPIILRYVTIGKADRKFIKNDQRLEQERRDKLIKDGDEKIAKMCRTMYRPS